MKNSHITKLCTTFNNSFVLEHLLQEFEVKVVDRINDIVGVTVLVDCTQKLIKELQNEFKVASNHPLIIID